MSIVKVVAVGQYGVNRDLSTHELPNNVWTNANNIRFVDGMAAQILGYSEIYPSAAVIPYHVLPVDVDNVRTWLYAGNEKIYSVNSSGIHTNITRQTTGVDVNYSAELNSWTSSVLGGIPILNNGLDTPQQWLLTGKATALTNWPAATFAKSLRSYKNSLIALNITKGASDYPYMVKWSHPADAGTVPVSWDESDPTKDAGEYDLSEGYDTIVDGLPLRDAFIIYKQSSIWRMNYTGGIYVYSFQKIISNQGVLSRNCVADVNGHHFVFSNSDCIIHDGQNEASVLDDKTRRDLFSQINSAKADLCFVFVNRMYNEVLACFPTLGSTFCNRALVWNYVDKTVSFRDMPNVNHADSGPVDDLSGATWDSDADSWDSDITPWDSQSASLNRMATVMASNDQKLYLLDSTNKNNGVAIESILERKGLSLGEPESMKLIRGVRPRIFGVSGTVNVQVGYGETPYSEPIYSTPVPFNVNSTVAVDTMVTGRYMAIKFSNGTAANWRLDSYDIDVIKAGSW